MHFCFFYFYPPIFFNTTITHDSSCCIISFMKKEKQKEFSSINHEAEKWTKELWEKFLEKISKMKSKTEIKKFLEKLISKNEKEMILKRLGVIALVAAGKSYQKISEILWLSPNTISTIKKNLLGDYDNYKSYLNFYGGKTKWSYLKKEDLQKSIPEHLLDLINLASLIFEPFLKRGTGITAHRYFDRFRK